MIKRIAFLFFGLLAFFNAAQAQRLVRLNMLEKSPLSNMIVVTKNDSTARYTKLVAGTGVTIAYNEADTTLTLSATASAGNTDEQTLTFDPATGNLAISNGNTVNLTEGIQDAVANMLIAGTNVTLTYDDGAGTLTIAASGAGGGASDLGSLTDVDTTGKANGYVLAYNAATSTWEAQDNTVRLSDLQDVDTTGKATGSIILYDATSGNWEAQSNSIDNLTDGYYDANLNLFLGKNPSYIVPGSSSARFNVGYGYFALDSIGTGYDNTAIGTSAMYSSKRGSYRNTALGRAALGGATHSSGFRDNYHANGVAIGAFSAGNDTLFFESITIGGEAGFGGHMTGKIRSLFIGSKTIPLDTISVDQIVIGAYAIPKGDSTVVIGREFYKGTYLHGNLNLNGYGAGNKEATDLTKTRSAYIAAFATDGTLLELDTTGLFGGGSGTPQTLTFLESTRELTISDGNTIDLSEGIQEEINSTLVAGTGITITYDDGAGTLTVAAPAGSGNTDEQTLSLDNATAVLSISNGNSVDLSEAIDNQVNTLTVAGTNITKVYDDGANTLTLSTTDALTAIDAITFDANTTTEVANRLQFNTDYNTLSFGMANATPIRIGQDLGWLVKNQTGTTIAKGVAVMAVGTVGASGRILIDELVADGSVDAHYFLGVTAETIADGADGFVTSQGHIRGINTSAFTASAVLYASPTTPGAFTATKPTGNDLKLPLAFVLNSDPTNGEIAVRADPGASIKDLHDVDVTGITDNSILKYNNTSGTWEIGTDLAESTTAANGLTLSGTDVKLGGTLSDATTTIDMNNNALTFTNNGGYNLSGTGGLSFTNTSATDYSSVLSIASTNTRIYADGGTTEPLNSLNLTSTRSGVKELDLRSSISNDNTTYTMIALNPTRFSMKTPNVTDLTATNGQFLKLVDRLTGEVEFDDIIGLTSLSVTTNSAGTAALSYNNTNGVFTFTPPDLSSYLTSEVDGSVTNEIQDLSLSGNTLSLSGDATTVDLSGYLDEATTASNGLTEVGNDIRLGGTLSTSVDIDALSTYNFSITDAANLTLSSSTVIEFNAGAGGVINNSTNFFQIGRSLGKILDFTQGTLRMDGYGVGNKEASDLSLTGSAYLASFATDGTLIEYPISSISGESTTASNGLTLSGSDVKLGGTLSEITNISMAGFNASIYDISSNTGFAIQPSSNLIVNYGTQAFDDYGSGNKEAADLSKTKSNYKAAFATDGTLIEVDDIDAMVVACSDETTDITTGTAKVTFRAPHAMTIVGVRASLTTASSSGDPTVDINEGGTSILGTKLSIDANEKTSTTAATAATITDTAIADDAEITIDIDAAGTGATGLKVTILYRKN